MKRRILVLLSVVALMVAMLAVGIAAAFAAPSPCPGKMDLIGPTNIDYDPAYDSNQDNLICRYRHYDKDNNFTVRLKDDRLVAG
jgi:hypothetical protein